MYPCNLQNTEVSQKLQDYNSDLCNSSSYEKNKSKRKITEIMAIQTEKIIIRGYICYSMELVKYGVTRNYEKDLHQKDYGGKKKQ
jgi:hypothetical protein